MKIVSCPAPLFTPSLLFRFIVLCETILLYQKWGWKANDTAKQGQRIPFESKSPVNFLKACN